MKPFKHITRQALVALVLCAALVVSAMAYGGNIRDERGHAIAGASVTCEINYGGSWRIWNGTIDAANDVYGADFYNQENPIEADFNGHYAWVLPAGEYRFIVSAPGYSDRISDPVTIPQSSTVSGDITMARAPTAAAAPTPTAAAATPAPTATPQPSNDSSLFITPSLFSGPVLLGSKLDLAPEPKVTVYYTTDGKRPTRSSTKYTGPILITGDVTIRAAAERYGTMYEPITLTFTVTDVISSAQPTATPAPLPLPSPTPAPITVTPSVPAGQPKWRESACTVRYMTGYIDGTFKPDQPVTRYEVADALIRLVDLGGTEHATCTLWDVPGSMAPTIARLQALGIINGMDDHTFEGERSLTRAEVCKMLCQIMQLEPDPYAGIIFYDTLGHWGTPYLGALCRGGYITGYPDGTFQPDRAMTRAELVKLINTAVGRINVPGTGVNYKDIKPSHWAYWEIQRASIAAGG